MHTTPGNNSAFTARAIPSLRPRAVILAGGEGVRLRPLTRRIAGDDRPKQFCPILGRKTLLEQTRRRVACSFAPKNISVVVTRPHEEYYAPLLGDYAPGSVVVQPDNRGTAAAILYSLLRLAQAAPGSAVAFFPSDHYVSDDRLFMTHVDQALAAVYGAPQRIVLLGITPETPEVEYGWIEPGAALARAGADLTCVRRFWEKPQHDLARVLLARGCLWNSFVMAGTVCGFLRLIERAAAGFCSAFDDLRGKLATPAESAAVERIYRGLPAKNFSKDVLVPRSEDLALLPVRGVAWSDLGTPRRVYRSLARARAQRGFPSRAGRALVMVS